MAFRTGGVVLGVLLLAAPAVAQQSAAPKLDKAQRDLLQAVVAGVDSATSLPETADAAWQTHVLRTSDGSHYVAFTLAPPESNPLPPRSTVYVRLATRQDTSAMPLAERSAVMEWLKGMRTDPLLGQKRRGIAFGEMPAFGAGAIAVRGPGQQTSDLALLRLESERARERRDAAEKERRETLEGTASARKRDAIYPFEDFSTNLTPVNDEPDGPPLLRRSLTSGPGEYELYVAWAAPPAKGQAPSVHVKKRSLRLPPASTTELALSSVIVADSVVTRETPYPPDQQSSHPYAIGPMEVVPARDETFTNDERLAIVFQVMNARASEAGKPDVAIGFQLFRMTTAGEQSVGMLNPQFYNATTLPPDFDLNQGHPLFVAMAAPLSTLPRGEYRLQIAATDRSSARSTGASLSFRIVATPQTLLATAPGAAPFRREDVLGPAMLRDVAERLRPAHGSVAMTAALDAARDARFMELLRDDAISESEQGARAALKGIGLYALGDARIACTILRQSMQTAANAATLLYLGGCRAIERNDREAIATWQEARAGGIPEAMVVPLLVGAHLRLGDPARARELAERLVTNGVPAAAIVTGLATAYVAQGREAEAIPLLDAHIAVHADDLEAQYILLRALFAGFVRGQGVGATPEGLDRFRTLARGYIDGKGRNATAVSEWLELVTP
jgi:hypothetical protein